MSTEDEIDRGTGSATETVASGPNTAEQSEPDPSETHDTGEAAPAFADPIELAASVEAILFVVEAPVTATAVAAALQQSTAAVQDAVDMIRSGYDGRNAGIELRDVAGGIRLFTRAAYAPQVELFLQDGQRSRLTQAALETLAVIAYRQPVTRARVSAIRGVNVDGVVRTLASRGLIVEVGSDPDTGGGLFRTTDLFLERMGLNSLTELPSLAPLLPELTGLEYDEL
ncbi:MAG: SMC-Scp complex subunit ScpB [Jatrophihabitantaceae bacterium]